MSANQPGEGEGPTPELLAELRALRTDVLQNRGLNAKEADVAVKASEMLRSSAFQELRAARAAGTSAEIRIDGVTVVYEPSIPEGISGMTLFGEKGFIMGPSAFRSGPETARTVLQELYRLNTSVIGPAGSAEAGTGVAEETAAAHEFADKALKALIGD